MAVIVRHQGAFAKIWFGERYKEIEDENQDVRQIEVTPHLVLTEAQMNELVIGWLRGPEGAPGPIGAMGAPGKDRVV